MALANKNPEEFKSQLQAWLRAQLPDDADLTIDKLTVPGANGLSNLTILFDASWQENGEQRREELVARVAPDGPAVFMTYDLGKEFSVMKALADQTGVPVPAPRWVEEDPSVIGAPFLIMDRASGQIPADDPPFTTQGWVLELSDDQQRVLCENSLKVLADIHAADWRALGLDFLVPETGSWFDAELLLWHRAFDWAREDDQNLTIEAGFDWLEEHRPSDEAEPVLNWGDARIGNMMFGDDLAVTAVLDWEMVSLGQPDVEVAWWLFILRHHTEGIGAPVPPGFPDRDEVIATYERLSGTSLQHVDYYEVWAAVRLSILMHRAGNLMVQAGLLPPESDMKLNNPASQLLAKLIDAPAPSGATTSFIGNR